MKKFNFLFLFVLLAMISTTLTAQKTATVKKQPMGLTIDGVGDETAWANADELVIDNMLNSVPDDDTDFSASFKLAWNDTALFFLAMVNDFDIYPYNHWAADGVEFYFGFGDGTIEGDNIFGDQVNGFFQVPFRINMTATGGYQQDSTENGAVAVVSLEDYTMEGYINWAQFNDNNGDTIVPVGGDSFTFDVNVQDNDNDPEGDDWPGFPGLTRGYWSSDAHLFESATGNWPMAGTVTLSDDVLDPSVVIGISDILRSSKYLVYPNVAVENQINLKGNADAISIYSAIGARVAHVELSGRKTVDVSKLSNGIYFVGFHKNNEIVDMKKFVK